jgi:hypothetical protein
MSGLPRRACGSGEKGAIVLQQVLIKRTLLVAAGLVLVASACGGGGSSTLSKADFLKQGNAICDAGNKTLDAASTAAFGNTTTQPDNAAIKKFIDETLAPNIKKQIDDIAALKAPSDLKSAVDAMLATARTELAKIQQQANTDPASIFSASDPFAEVNRQATAIGLSSCASNSSNSASSASTAN